MKAEGKVMGLDADNRNYPGSVVVEITCSLEQSRVWAHLFGKDIVAEVAPALAPHEPDLSQQASLPGVDRG